jgi:hypothetical protein
VLKPVLDWRIGIVGLTRWAAKKRVETVLIRSSLASGKRCWNLRRQGEKRRDDPALVLTF